MTISEGEMNELLVSVSSRCERGIALAIFNIESVLRELISLIAAHPEKLQEIGGPIRSVERVKLMEGAKIDNDSHHVFNVEVSVDPMSQQLEVNEQEISLDGDSEQHIGAESMQIVDNCTDDEMGEQLIVGAGLSEGGMTEESCLTASIDDGVEVTTITTTDEEGVKVRIQSIEAKAKSAAGAKAKEPVNMHQCPQCDKTFLRTFELQRHITVRHTNEKKFECEHCGQKFALKLYLNNHIRSKHLPDREKPFGCPHCDYRCILQSLLTRHMAKHINEKGYKCDVCGKYFYAQKHLKRHMYRHREKDIECEFCEFKTADPYKLRSHQKVHTSTEVFPCNQCDFKTNVKSELTKHTLSAHPEFEYKCDQCELAFKRPGNLKRHQYVHQEKTLLCTQQDCNWRTADPYELKRHQLEHSNGKKHVCGTCGFGFYRAFDLKKHLKTHSKVHLCKECNTVFADSHALSCHKRRRHPKVRSGSQIDECANQLDSAAAAVTPSDGSSIPNTGTIISAGDNSKSVGAMVEGNSSEVVVPTQSKAQPVILSSGRTHSIVIDETGQAVIVDDQSAVYDGYITVVPESDQQLLEMASVIIAQAGENNTDTSTS